MEEDLIWLEEEMSQSPQIGSMFLTEKAWDEIKANVLLFKVAIPSNRVNVSNF